MECVPMMNAGHVVGQATVTGPRKMEKIMNALMNSFAASQFFSLGSPTGIHVIKDLWEKSQVPSSFQNHHPEYQEERNLEKILHFK